MENVLPVILKIIHEYGDGVFSNMPRTNAMLLDLAPGFTRERILIRNFIEINGYHILKNAGKEYPLLRSQIIRSLIETFCLEQAAAEWTVGLFAAALGYAEAPIGGFILPEAAALSSAAPFPAPPVDLQGLVAIGKAHMVAAAADGTVFAHGLNDRLQCDVSGWRGIIAVAAGDMHTLGLRADGTVLATGSNTYDQCDVGHLTDMVSVYAFGSDSVCVGKDGMVMATGRSAFDLSHFNDIKTVAKYPEGLFGIRRDGTVQSAYSAENIAPKGHGTPEAKQNDTLISNRNTPLSGGENWLTDGDTSLSGNDEVDWALSLTDAKQIISTYVQGSIVLKNDGRIYKMNAPDNYFAQWRDVVSMVDLSDYFAILRADGTVRILSYDRDRPHLPAASDRWRGITAIYGKYKRLIGLTRDGNLKAVCTDPDWLRRNGPLDYVSDWYPIGI